MNIEGTHGKIEKKEVPRGGTETKKTSFFRYSKKQGGRERREKKKKARAFDKWGKWRTGRSHRGGFPVFPYRAGRVQSKRIFSAEPKVRQKKRGKRVNKCRKQARGYSSTLRRAHNASAGSGDKRKEEVKGKDTVEFHTEPHRGTIILNAGRGTKTE